MKIIDRLESEVRIPTVFARFPPSSRAEGATLDRARPYIFFSSETAPPSAARHGDIDA